MSRIMAMISLVIALGLVNWSIAGKEKQLAEGRVVYLELAPVDPRSLMQGDYMVLNYRMANEVRNNLPVTNKHRGWLSNVNGSKDYVVITLDERNIGSYNRLYNDEVLAKEEILMRYRVRNGAVKFATNAFFFQEGHGNYYQSARFGQFRVDNSGELLLVAMYDKDLNKLIPAEKK